MPCPLDESPHCVPNCPMIKRIPILMAALMSFASIACTGGDEYENFCEQTGGTPSSDEIASGRVTATQDGSTFDEAGTWSATSGSLTGGLLDIIIQQDDSGERTADRIASGDFPICIMVGERSETSGQANLVQGGFVSNASNTGSLAIYAEENDEIVGRFSFSLENTSGEKTVFEDGLFRVGER